MLSKVEKTICKHKVQFNNYVSALGGGVKQTLKNSAFKAEVK